MYPVSNAFLEKIQENTRDYYWTGEITTKNGATYSFENKDILKGSGYINNKSCSAEEIELGSVYAAELKITLYNNINRYTLTDAEIRLTYHLVLDDDTVEDVPMGVFIISEANRNIKTLEIEALTNGTETFSIYTNNDIETWRDVLYYG